MDMDAIAKLVFQLFLCNSLFIFWRKNDCITSSLEIKKELGVQVLVWGFLKSAFAFFFFKR